jgi:serine/threonine-protein kinase
VQEIRTTAQLQHPHILPLYDSGSIAAPSSGGPELLYYVMPYIEGETLRERLDREQQLGIDEAVRITTEVADALQHAHERGVVHRDIKPENILLRDGRAFVADFGIALAVSAATGGRMTETGLSLGTPQYMSPEQATADRHVTNRSDLYSLGSVLYELLTGDPPHTGSSAQVIILKIVSEVARPVSELRRSVPPHVAAALAKALEKLPADRFDSAKAFADALRNPAFNAPVVAQPTVAAAARSTRGFAVPALAGLLLLAVAIGAWSWLRPGRSTAVTRHATTLGTDGVLDGITFGVEVALAPDGSSVVFRSPLTGPGQLYMKRRDDVIARPLAGTEGGSGPFFSPDGSWIGFVANGQLRRIPSAGGASLTLADSVLPTYNRAAWLDDGSIVFYDFTAHSLRRLGAGDVASTLIVSPDMLEGRYPWLPSPLPDARGVLFTAHRTLCVGPVSCRPSRVYVYDARRDTMRALLDDAIGAWHVPTGHVLYLTSAGTLMAAPWDNTALDTTGRSVPVLDGVQAPGFVVSNDGTAYYVLGPSEFAPGPVPNATVVWVDRDGRVQPVDSSWQVNTGGTDDGGVGTDWGLSLSPDGRRIALSLLTDQGSDVWIKQLPTGPATRLTLDAGIDQSPTWTPDGRAVTFLSDRSVAGDASGTRRRFFLWQQAADGTGEPELLWSRDGATEAFRSPDGRWLVFGTRSGTGASAQGDLFAVRPGVDSVARRLVATPADEQGAALSPDGRWLAYVSDEQGVPEVFVRPFPDVNGGKWQVSSGGGSAPRWANNGRELFYIANGRMHVIRVSGGATFSAESPRVLFDIPEGVRAGALASGTFAISPDDQRFLMVRDNRWADMAGTPRLVVVQGFFEELRAKMRP